MALIKIKKPFFTKKEKKLASLTWGSGLLSGSTIVSSIFMHCYELMGFLGGLLSFLGGLLPFMKRPDNKVINHAKPNKYNIKKKSLKAKYHHRTNENE